MAIHTETSMHRYNKDEDKKYRDNFDDIFGKKKDKGVEDEVGSKEK